MRSLYWFYCRDEKNLEENERIKKELNPRKIEEPKTPYHRSPWGTDDEAEVLGERTADFLIILQNLRHFTTFTTIWLELNRELNRHPGLDPNTERSGIEPLTLNEADFSQARLTRIQTTSHNSPWSDNSTGTSPSPHGNSSARGSTGRSPRFSEEYYREDSDDEDGNDDESTLEKRKKFKEARKSHYQMKDAMRRWDARWVMVINACCCYYKCQYRFLFWQHIADCIIVGVQSERAT